MFFLAQFAFDIGALVVFILFLIACVVLIFIFWIRTLNEVKKGYQLALKDHKESIEELKEHIREIREQREKLLLEIQISTAGYLEILKDIREHINSKP